jgi:hypothetical protein
MSILFQWWDVHSVAAWGVLCGGVLATIIAVAWYVHVFKMHIVEPLRSTHDPVTASRRNQAKISKRLLLWIFFTWVTISAIGGFMLWCFVRQSVEPLITQDEYRPLVPLGAFMIVGLPVEFMLLMVLGWFWRRPVRLFCPSCGKYVPGNLPWFCGRCNSENRAPKHDDGLLASSRHVRHSFLHKCKACGAKPVAFHCQHCTEAFVLDRTWMDADKREVERLAAYMIQGAPPQPESREKVKERQVLHVENLEHRITVAELETRLAQRKKELDTLRTCREEKPIPTTRERLQQTFDRQHEEFLAVHELARVAQARAEEKYRDDPEMLEMENAVIQQFVEKHAML